MTMTEHPVGWPTGRRPTAGTCPSCAERTRQTGIHPVGGTAHGAQAPVPEAPATADPADPADPADASAAHARIGDTPILGAPTAKAPTAQATAADAPAPAAPAAVPVAAAMKAAAPAAGTPAAGRGAALVSTGTPPLPGAAPHHAVDHERPETARDRVNRRWNEILQETRVAQTGVQILFGFLLSVAFSPLFRDLAMADRVIYVITVVLGASATASLIAPVSLHRFLSGQRMKDEMVDIAHKLMMCGMVLLALTIGCTLLLILHVVVSGLLAELLVAGVMLWFALCWYVLPLWLRRRSARRLARRSVRS